MNDKRHISHLLGKYLDGETSRNEENALRAYFAKAGNDIPEEWRPYKATFEYVTAEKAAATGHGAIRAKRIRMARTCIASAAASALIIISVPLSSPRAEENYTVINGKVYTDEETVMEEALEALQMVASDEDDTFGALDMMRQ